MTLDPLTTSLVAMGTGAVGVAAHAIAHYADGSMRRSHERTITALFFALLSGFLFAWVWHFASSTVLDAARLPPALVGALWGALVWGAFTLPAEMAHVVWGRQEASSATRGLAAWLAQFLVGGVLCGIAIVP